MSTVVAEERGGLGHANSVSYEAPGRGRGPIRNCIGRGQHVKRRKRRLILFYSAEGPSQLSNSDTSVAHRLAVTDSEGQKKSLSYQLY
jgi:hypothetical protein